MNFLRISSYLLCGVVIFAFSHPIRGITCAALILVVNGKAAFQGVKLPCTSSKDGGGMGGQDLVMLKSFSECRN